MIDFLVGSIDDIEIVTIHKAVLQRCTSKFDKDMQPPSVAGGNATVNDPTGGMCNEVFHLFRDFLYTGQSPYLSSPIHE